MHALTRIWERCHAVSAEMSKPVRTKSRENEIHTLTVTHNLNERYRVRFYGPTCGLN